MEVYTVSTTDWTGDDKSIIIADNDGRDLIATLEADFEEGLTYELHDIEDLIQVETNYGFPTLKGFDLDELKELITDIKGEYTAENIEEYYIEIKPEYKNYNGAEIVQNYIDDLRSRLYQL